MVMEHQKHSIMPGQATALVIDQPGMVATGPAVLLGLPSASKLVIIWINNLLSG